MLGRSLFDTHGQGQVARSEESDVHAFNGQDRLCVVDALLVLDLRDDEDLFVGDSLVSCTVDGNPTRSGGAMAHRGVAHGVNDGPGLLGRAHVGDHDAERAGVQDLSQCNRVVIPGPHEGGRAARLDSAEGVCDEGDVKGGVLGVDGHPVEPACGHDFGGEG